MSKIEPAEKPSAKKTENCGFPALFRSSAKEFRSPRCLAVTGLLLAMDVLLIYCAVQLTPTLRFSFNFLTMGIAGMLFGPAVGMGFGVLSDLLGIIVKGYSFFPGFTLTALLKGFVYGIFLYKKKPTFLRCLAVQLTVDLFLNLGLNTLWNAILYNKAFWAILGERVIKNVILFPVEAVILFGVSKAAADVYARMNRTSRRSA